MLESAMDYDPPAEMVKKNRAELNGDRSS